MSQDQAYINIKLNTKELLSSKEKWFIIALALRRELA
jgi:hypothetical protein